MTATFLQPARFPSLTSAIDQLTHDVRAHGEDVPVEKWHGVPTEGKPDLMTVECRNVCITAPMPEDRDFFLDHLREDCKPNLPWADDHFYERVSGQPLNPGNEFRNWPWYQEGSKWDESYRDSGRFTHTYMERFWPKQAADNWDTNGLPMTGIRYPYGDLHDVVDLLIREPYTRQAWLPVWFPEDTGAVHGGRVPCTLGYQFMLREDKLHLWYVIRSCDVIRFLRDDIYMAIRLADWVLTQCLEANDAIEEGAELNPWQVGVTLGDFTFTCFSLHMFEGDRYVSS